MEFYHSMRNLDKDNTCCVTQLGPQESSMWFLKPNQTPRILFSTWRRHFCTSSTPAQDKRVRGQFLIDIELYSFPLSFLPPAPSKYIPSLRLLPPTLKLIVSVSWIVILHACLCKCNLMRWLLLIVCVWFHGWPLSTGKPIGPQFIKMQKS